MKTKNIPNNKMIQKYF